MFRLFRSRLLWLAIGCSPLAVVAFWLVVVAVAVVMTTVSGDAEPDELARLAVPLGLLAALAAVAAAIAVTVMVRRGRVREWLPLREHMVHDAATQPTTQLVQVLSPANPAAGGQITNEDHDLQPKY